MNHCKRDPYLQAASWHHTFLSLLFLILRVFLPYLAVNKVPSIIAYSGETQQTLPSVLLSYNINAQKRQRNSLQVKVKDHLRIRLMILFGIMEDFKVFMESFGANTYKIMTCYASHTRSTFATQLNPSPEVLPLGATNFVYYLTRAYAALPLV